MLAVVQWDLKEKEKALQQLNKTQRIDAEYAPTQFMFGLIYRETGQSKLARKHLERYLQLAPKGSYAATAREWLAKAP